MPSNRDGMMFVPKNNRETLLTSCNDSFRNSESQDSEYDIYQNQFRNMKTTFLNNSMIVEYDETKAKDKKKDAKLNMSQVLDAC